MFPLKRQWSNPLVRFFTYAFALYILWFLAYDLWLQPGRTVDLFVIDSIRYHSEVLLELFGFTIGAPVNYGEGIRTIGLEGTQGVWIGDSCNGLTLFALFTGFVLAYPGPIKIKLWFIPLGIITIHLLNVIRVSSLAVIAKYNPESLDFNHTYTFTILVYSYVFLLWYVWAEKLSGVGKKV